VFKGSKHLTRNQFFAVVILKLEGDLNIVKMYLHAENEVAFQTYKAG